jgi:MFS family permease
VPLLLGLEEPARGATENRLLPAGSARELLRIPAFRWIVVSGAVVNFSLYVLSTFLPAFLSRYHGLSLASAGLWSGLGQGAFGLLGGVAAGQLGDFVMRRRAGGRLYSAAAAAFCAGPAALLAILQPAGSAATAVLLLMAAYGLLNMYYGLVYAAIQDIVAPAARGFAMALYYMAMYLCGAAFGPVLTGSLSDLLARRAAGGAALTEAARATGLHQALYVLPLLCSVLALVLAAGGRSMRAEPRTTERIVLYNKK